MAHTHNMAKDCYLILTHIVWSVSLNGLLKGTLAVYARGGLVKRVSIYKHFDCSFTLWDTLHPTNTNILDVNQIVSCRHRVPYAIIGYKQQAKQGTHRNDEAWRILKCNLWNQLCLLGCRKNVGVPSCLIRLMIYISIYSETHSQKLSKQAWPNPWGFRKHKLRLTSLHHHAAKAKNKMVTEELHRYFWSWHNQWAVTSLSGTRHLARKHTLQVWTELTVAPKPRNLKSNLTLSCRELHPS